MELLMIHFGTLAAIGMLLCIVHYAYHYNEPVMFTPFHKPTHQTHYFSLVFARNAFAIGYTVEVTLPDRPLIDIVRRKVWL